MEVVGRHAKVTGVIVGVRVAGQVGGEPRRGVARRNHDQARVADDGRRRHGRGRAVCSDDAGHLRVPDDSKRTFAAAFRRTTGVNRIAQVDLAPVNGTQVLDGELGPVPGHGPQRRRDRDRKQHADPHGLACLQSDRTQRHGLEFGRCGTWCGCTFLASRRRKNGDQRRDGKNDALSHETDSFFSVMCRGVTVYPPAWTAAPH